MYNDAPADTAKPCSAAKETTFESFADADVTARQVSATEVLVEMTLTHTVRAVTIFPDGSTRYEEKIDVKPISGVLRIEPPAPSCSLTVNIGEVKVDSSGVGRPVYKDDLPFNTLSFAPSEQKRSIAPANMYEAASWLH